MKKLGFLMLLLSVGMFSSIGCEQDTGPVTPATPAVEEPTDGGDSPVVGEETPADEEKKADEANPEEEKTP